MWKWLVISLALTVILTDTANCLRILGIFPHLGASHFRFFHPIVKRLAEIGHQVTVVSHFPEKNPHPNYHDLILAKEGELSINLEHFADNRHFYSDVETFIMVSEWAIDACRIALNSSAIQTVLKRPHDFDIIVMEQFNSDCMMGIAWKLQVPVIALSSCSLIPWHFERFGNPQLPSYIPSQVTDYTEQMTYTQRLFNWFSSTFHTTMYRLYTEQVVDGMLREYFGNDDMPYLGDLAKTTSVILVNTHYSLNGVRPNTPAVIEVGGLHIKNTTINLDADLEDFINSATHGVVYVSWGSMIKADTLPAVKRQHLVNAFSSLKQKVLWKWENDTIPNKSENILIRKWMPQLEILCHPNVRVFLTHGGLFGSSEAAYCGVPVVVTPLFGDQFSNAAALKSRGMGETVNYGSITTESVKAAIERVLKPEAQENAKKVSFSYRNRPQKPLDTAIWWIEHVAATKGAPLTKSYASHIHWFIYLSFDVYLTLLTVLVVCILGWIVTIKKLFVKGNRKQKSKEQ